MASTPSLRFDLDLADSLDGRIVPDALVVQEDRNLVMAKQLVLDLDVEHELDAAYAAVTQHRPLPQGRYVVLRPRNGQPYWIYQAVVHDLELKPSCRPGDVRRSLTAVVDDAVRRDLHSIAVEPLGRIDDQGLSFDEMVEALTSTVLEIAVALPEELRLTLMLADLDQLEEISNLLRSRILRMASRSFRTVDGDAAVVEVRQRGTRLHFRFVPGSLSGYMVTRVAPKD